MSDFFCNFKSAVDYLLTRSDCKYKKPSLKLQQLMDARSVIKLNLNQC